MDRIKTETYKFTAEEVEFLLKRHLENTEQADVKKVEFEWLAMGSGPFVVVAKTEAAVQTVDLVPLPKGFSGGTD